MTSIYAPDVDDWDSWQINSHTICYGGLRCCSLLSVPSIWCHFARVGEYLSVFYRFSVQYVGRHDWYLKINLPALVWLKLWDRQKTNVQFSGGYIFSLDELFLLWELYPHTSFFSPVFAQYFYLGQIGFILRYSERYLFSNMQVTCVFCEALQPLSLGVWQTFWDICGCF